ncbi:hypothetical protein HELRODRAFT_113060 [Helobdella robusta]|uniref:Uncharacterized protein n=1 Tax=Helobdella robusta TaxID=6412 RepID=T1EFQ0_HELRO|nr:hypothetical protein HELRODRAFT_113060 [Helobdella robusta]ESO00943.1 hypothetical protein HELRODRAFT_113060 [Helobdella robusta]
MDDSEKKAMEMMAQAEKKLKSSSGFLGSLMGGNSKVEDAAELYTKAGHSFKMAKKWGDAGNAYSKAAGIHQRLGNKLETASHFIDCGNCFKKVDRKEAVNYLLKAIEVYVDMGRFTIAAKHHMEIAELYEQEPVDIKEAMEYYQRAADFYQGEESNSSANRCLLKVAQYASELEMYDKAATIYENIGTSSMDNPLLRHGAKDHFFRAVVCRLCQDVQDAENALVKYSDICTVFGDSREVKLTKALLAAIEEKDGEAFGAATKDYDSISRLDPWFVKMFLRVKKTIDNESDLL